MRRHQMTGSETVSVPATIAGLSQAAALSQGFCERQRLPDGLRRNVLTALDEVLSNVVRHGMAGREGQIRLRMSRSDTMVTVEVIDPAGTFNPLLAPAPDTTAALDARRAGGLGIALVRALTHEVAYERKNDHNHLTLRWRLDGGGHASTHADS